MIRAPLTHHNQLVSPPQGNITGIITNLVEEKSLTEGDYAFSADRQFQLQINEDQGQGMGANPFSSFGFFNTTFSEKTVVYDGEWIMIRVPVGRTLYLNFRKGFGAGEGTYFLNLIGVP